jgi:hypothetical protein
VILLTNSAGRFPALVCVGLFGVSTYVHSASSLSSAELTSQEIADVYSEFYGQDEVREEESFLEADADVDADADAEADVDAEVDAEAEAEVEAEAGEEQTAVTKCGKKITWVCEAHDSTQQDTSERATGAR